MKEIIFKSPTKAKIYYIRSSKDQACYSKGELLRTVKTDDIDKILNDSTIEIYATIQ